MKFWRSKNKHPERKFAWKIKFRCYGKGEFKGFIDDRVFCYCKSYKIAVYVEHMLKESKQFSFTNGHILDFRYNTIILGLNDDESCAKFKSGTIDDLLKDLST